MFLREKLRLQASHIILFFLVLFMTAPVFGAAAKPAPGRAKNVVLFIGDAGGIPTLHAASIYEYGKPQQLYLNRMPHVALVDTSAANSWSTDSAAGMTAIMAGVKTNNGVLSQTSDAVKGEKDGRVLKTLLEYAEERGLATGVVTNMPVTDATPAACYAHVNDRANTAAIFAQLLSPSAGDGVDFVAGPGLPKILQATGGTTEQLKESITRKGYRFVTVPEEVPSNSSRVIALFESAAFDLPAMTRRAIDVLSRDPDGFFLMVECDMHTSKLKLGLARVIIMDRMVRETAERLNRNTLILFTADHSYDLRVRGGRPGQPLLPDETQTATPAAKPAVRVDDSHTGEEVLAAATGPGAERVKGFLLNTDLFHVMFDAYGWKPEQQTSRSAGSKTAPASR